MPASPLTPTSAPAPATLAEARLPRRVRGVLENVLRLASSEIQRRLEGMLGEFEQQLFRLADHARNPAVESGYLQTLRNMRLNRADLVPRYMLGIEASLARLGRNAASAVIDEKPATPATPSFHNLSLVEHDDMDDELILRDIAQRSESAASLPLHLLGQRFGVLAASPAFDADRVPLGPRTLCRILQTASETLQLTHESQHLLLRTFERKVMADYPALVEQLNKLMAEEGILPSLTYVPLRMRNQPPVAGVPQPEPETASTRGAGAAARGHPTAGAAGGTYYGGTHGGGGGGASGGGGGGGGAHGPGGSSGSAGGHGGEGAHGVGAGTGTHGGAGGGYRGVGGGHGPAGSVAAAHGFGNRMRPHTGWSLTESGASLGDQPAFPSLQEMLRGRDGDTGVHGAPPPHGTLPTPDLVNTLHQLRTSGGVGSLINSSISDIKQEVIERVRSQLGPESGLSLDDSDTFDLLGMLYDRIERDVRIDTVAGELIKRLQVPMLQLALSDRAFFAKPQHPARELLNTVAETGARWLGEGDIDPALEKPLRSVVDHVVERAHEDPSVFETSNRVLQHEMQQQARRAEMAERRHVEAARGKEKLEIAKRQATDNISAMIGAHKPPKFVRALLEQAWADVLTLTLLRSGAESDAWRDMQDTTRRIVSASCGREPVPDPELAGQVQGALAQVGYHGDEAAAIAKRLTSVRDDAEDGVSPTQLAATVKARARLGEQGAAPKKSKVKLPPRTAEEEAQYERVRVLPYGTWIEFVINQQGDIERKRLSWYSPITDNALFVNLRGQRVGEQSLDSLARAIARGQARVVTVEHARLVDRAWQATLGALRGLSKRLATPQPWQAPA